MRKLTLLMLIGVLVLSFPIFSNASAESTTNIEIILDSSASMAEAVNGVKKDNAARKAVKEVLDLLPETYNVSFRLYSHRFSQQNQEKSCKDTEVIIPFQKYSEEMKQTIENKLLEVTPKGLTPIAYTLKRAAEDFEGKSGKNIIILVSDGEETCGGNPLAVAENINSLDPGVKVYVIGFDVKSSAQLEGIAKKAGGSYYDAKNAKELNTVLKEAVEEATQVTRPTVNLPFTDNFEEEIASAWRTESVGELTLGTEKGEMTIKGKLVEDRLLKAFVGSASWSNYVLSVDIRYDKGSYYAGGSSYPWNRDNRVALFVRAQDQTNMVGFFLQPGGKAGFRVKKYGIWSDMESAGNIPKKNSFNVVISVRDNKYVAMVNDQRVVSSEFSTFQAGFVGLQVAVDKELKAYFDNFKVIPIES